MLICCKLWICISMKALVIHYVAVNIIAVHLNIHYLEYCLNGALYFLRSSWFDWIVLWFVVALLWLSVSSLTAVFCAEWQIECVIEWVLNWEGGKLILLSEKLNDLLKLKNQLDNSVYLEITIRATNTFQPIRNSHMLYISETPQLPNIPRLPDSFHYKTMNRHTINIAENTYCFLSANNNFKVMRCLYLYCWIISKRFSDCRSPIIIEGTSQ